MIYPDWPAPSNVHAAVSTRALGDMARGAPGRAKLRALVPAEPIWLRQVHGTQVIDAEAASGEPQGDAAIARHPGTVCAVLVADCMPVMLCDAAGTVVGIAHAGWRGLAAGVLEAVVERMGVSPEEQLAWLGPAIGPRVYEVGANVRAAFPGHDAAFSAARPGHWLLDLYAVARQRLAARGVRRMFGGQHCTYSEAERFYSYRRERTAARMAAVIWLT